MGTLSSRWIVCTILVALTAGCGGSQSAIDTLQTRQLVKPETTQTQTFGYTGAAQTFTVPSDVTRITVVAQGASGPNGYRYTGGSGGYVKATISVKPGDTLAVYVGGEGQSSKSASTGGSGGFNGGGNGGDGAPSEGSGGDGGGGASDVRMGGTDLVHRVIVAGGGGGGSASEGYGWEPGGAGGGKIGAQGGSGYYCSPNGIGGFGGSQHVGGKGGAGGDRCGYAPHPGHGLHGGLGRGGTGGGGKRGGGGGGGGGGGYYGGGGGGAGSWATSGFGTGGGGGGGSSFVERGATHVKNQQGRALPGDGVIYISW